jgi:hypothetical protein
VHAAATVPVRKRTICNMLKSINPDALFGKGLDLFDNNGEMYDVILKIPFQKVEVFESN